MTPMVTWLRLVLSGLQVRLRLPAPSTAGVASSKAASIATGAASTFATMTANTAGSVMTLHLVAQGAKKRA